MSTTGSGTKADPYVITTYSDFYTLTHNVGTERWIKLANNIDLNYATWDRMWTTTTTSQRPKCHVDLNGYGFLHVVVPSVNVYDVNNPKEAHIFCGYEWYNGTIDVHSDPDDLTPPLSIMANGFYGNITDSMTTFTNVKFTGYINIVPEWITLSKAIYYTTLFRGMFNYCVWNMDVNFSSCNQTDLWTTNLSGTQAVFYPNYNQTISDYKWITPDQAGMCNCDVNIRAYDWGYPYNNAQRCYLIRPLSTGTIALYNNRFRGSMGSRAATDMKGWFLTSYATAFNSDYLTNNVVSIDFRYTIPTLQYDCGHVVPYDLVSTRSGYPTPVYDTNLFNTDYLRYVKLKRGLTANGFTGCTISEITYLHSLREKGLRVYSNSYIPT